MHLKEIDDIFLLNEMNSSFASF